MENIKKSTKIGLLISAILVLIGIGFSIFTFITDFTGRPIGIQIHMCWVFVMYFVVLIYSLWGYKKPHGNMLRYVIFAFGLVIMLKLLLPGRPDTGAANYAANGCDGLAVTLIVFMSGRLQNIDKNKILMLTVGILLTAGGVILSFVNPAFNINSFARSLSQPICWAALCLAYTARYEQHKAAGQGESI